MRTRPRNLTLDRPRSLEPGAAAPTRALPKLTATGSKWVPQRFGALKLCIGGEGENPGSINVNPMVGNRLTMQQILTRDPTGAVISAGAEALPFPDGSVAEIRANALPSPVLAQHAKAIATEVKRVLVTDGTAVLSSRTTIAPDVASIFTSHGFHFRAGTQNTLHFVKSKDE